MPRSITHAIVTAIVFLIAAEAFATPYTIVQTGTFHTTYTAFADSQSNQYLFFTNSGTAAAAMNPFDSALGTLDKVTIDWNIGQSFTGTTGSSGGGVTLSFGGTAYVNTSPYGGGGGGAGGGDGPATAISYTQANELVTKQFVASQAGVSYDPLIWAAFTGVTPYDAIFAVSNSGQYLQYVGIASGTSTAYRDVTVTYEYTPAVPEIDAAGAASMLALVTGLLGLVERRRTKTA